MNIIKIVKNIKDATSHGSSLFLINHLNNTVIINFKTMH